MKKELIPTSSLTDNYGKNEIDLARHIIYTVYSFTMSKVPIVSNILTIFYN